MKNQTPPPIIPMVKLDDDLFLVHKEYNQARMTKGYESQKPKRLILDEKIKDTEDFIRFANEYKTPETKVFYNEKGVEVIFNYSTTQGGDFADSRLVMDFELTQECKFLGDFLNRPITQKKFIHFLKAMAPSIHSPDPVDVIALAENIQAIKKINSIKKNSSQKLIIDAEIKGGLGSVAVPETLTLSIPVFENNRETKLDLFEVELFFDFGEEFQIEMVCHHFARTRNLALRSLAKEVADGIQAPHFQR